MTVTIYLTPQQLAERYGVQVKTLQHWRWRTRKGKDYGPKWEEIPPQPLRKKFMTIRYNFDNVLAWEKENNNVADCEDKMEQDEDFVALGSDKKRGKKMMK